MTPFLKSLEDFFDQHCKFFSWLVWDGSNRGTIVLGIHEGLDVSVRLVISRLEDTSHSLSHSLTHTFVWVVKMIEEIFKNRFLKLKVPSRF